jgi:hypothetical protein
VVQPIGRVGGKLVVYGMGNHLSNQNSMWGPKYDSTEDGVIVHLTVEEQPDGRFAVTSAEYTPTMVEMTSYRVLPVAWARAVGTGDARLLSASEERTTGYVTMLGGEAATATAAAWPPLLCAGRVADLVGTAGPDVLLGTPGRDVITGRGGDDTIQGYAGNDFICGADGDDALWGGPGLDGLYGGAGDDTLYGGGDRDVLWGERGDDALWGEQGPDSLYGGLGDDGLWGQEGADLLVGGPGDDVLWGGLGADTLQAPAPGDAPAVDGEDSCILNGRAFACG